MVDHDPETIIDQIDLISLDVQFQEFPLFQIAETINLGIIIIKLPDQNLFDISTVQLTFIQISQHKRIGRIIPQIIHDFRYAVQVRNLHEILFPQKSCFHRTDLGYDSTVSK